MRILLIAFNIIGLLVLGIFAFAMLDTDKPLLRVTKFEPILTIISYSQSGTYVLCHAPTNVKYITYNWQGIAPMRDLEGNMLACVEQND